MSSESRVVSRSYESLAGLALRAAFAMCFIGHGAFGLLQKREWLPFFAAFGIGDSSGLTLMPLIGSVDIAIGVAGLLLPLRIVFLYGAVWCVFTAALRPISGQSMAELIERAGNYGAPAAMLALTAGGSWLARAESASIDARTRARLATVCIWSSVLLLAGHGWLALQNKPLLERHLALAGVSSEGVRMFGATELLLAAACIFVPHPILFIGIAAWKIATESLFIFAGAPIWEFIERGGSYIVPLVGAIAVSRPPRTSVFRLARAATVAGIAATCLVAPAFAQSPPMTVSPDLLHELQQGGLIVACRHAITSHDREDRMPPNFDDPSTQRLLSPEGEQQAKTVGEALAALKIRFGAVLASPFDRTRKSAEFMAGKATIDEALSSTARGKDAELRALMTGPVDAGTNRLVVTHQGLFYRIFRGLKQGSIEEGDCLIVRPGTGEASILAHVTPAEWTRLAARQK